MKLVPPLSERPAQPDRRRSLLGALSLVGLAGCGALPVTTAAPPTAIAGRGITPFSATRQRWVIPEGWHPHVMRRDLPATRYQLIDHDGRCVLHAHARGATSGLRCDVDIHPQQTPWLDWAWRVDQPLTDATVADDELDDASARIVIAFDGDVATLPLRDQLFRETVEAFTGHTLPYATLMYVWDGQAAPGTVLQYHRSASIRYLVVQSGAAQAGRWLQQRRNVVDDYRHVFGAEPGRIRSVGVMTDSDDLKTVAEAWFGDLRFS